MLAEILNNSQAEPPDTTCQLVLYFQGVGLTAPQAITGKADWETFRLGQECTLRLVKVSDAKRDITFLQMLVDLYTEIKEKFKENVAMISPRRLCRLWGTAYEMKLGIWINMVINCVKLKIIPNDEQNGFYFIPCFLIEESLKMPQEELAEIGVGVFARSARDYCNYCDDVAKKKCSRCRNVHYCSDHCQQEDWKKHKIVCQKI